jgi:hypothetical protein
VEGRVEGRVAVLLMGEYPVRRTNHWLAMWWQPFYLLWDCLLVSDCCSCSCVENVCVVLTFLGVFSCNVTASQRQNPSG